MLFRLRVRNTSRALARCVAGTSNGSVTVLCRTLDVLSSGNPATRRLRRSPVLLAFVPLLVATGLSALSDMIDCLLVCR